MNLETYNEIYNYLEKQKLPDLNSKEKQKFIRRSNKFEIKNNQLYKRFK